MQQHLHTSSSFSRLTVSFKFYFSYAKDRNQISDAHVARRHVIIRQRGCVQDVFLAALKNGKLSERITSVTSVNK